MARIDPKTDDALMRHALVLAQRGLGRVAPNPSVGCVIMADGIIAGRGWTKPGGRPHAETVALDQAASAAKGACAYMTLEPCAHTGKTPPCAEALVAAGIKRAVIATGDRDARVAGKGFEILERAGIEVVRGVCERQARAVNAGFFSVIEKGRPLVQLKLGVSGDHKIAAKPGARTAISGDEALKVGHMLRARADAILVGRGTVAADDPSLTCRIAGLEERSPIRVVLDSELKISIDSQLAQTAKAVPVMVLCTRQAGTAKEHALGKAGIAVIRIGDGPAIDPMLALAALAKQGVTRLLVEGGAQIAASFIKAGVVDQIHIFQADRIIGAPGVDALSGRALEDVLTGSDFELISQKPVGQDLWSVYNKV